MDLSREKGSLMRNCLLLFMGILCAQFAVGQKQPESLGSAINSEFSELNPVMAPDGKTLYFGRSFLHANNT